jgi:hypothetical protein
MRESRTYGSVRGAPSNGRPYRVKPSRCAQREPPTRLHDNSAFILSWSICFIS